MVYRRDHVLIDGSGVAVFVTDDHVYVPMMVI